MNVVAALSADVEAAEPVQECVGVFDDPSVDAESGAVLGASAGDHGLDAFAAHELAVLVVGAVGVDPLGSVARSAASVSGGWDGLDQWRQLGDVVAVAAGQGGREWDTGAVGDHMVLGAGAGAVDRARSGLGRPSPPGTWEPSTAVRDQSISPAALSLASNGSCRRCHTSASVQSRRRR